MVDLSRLWPHVVSLGVGPVMHHVDSFWIDLEYFPQVGCRVSGNGNDLRGARCCHSISQLHQCLLRPAIDAEQKWNYVMYRNHHGTRRQQRHDIKRTME